MAQDVEFTELRESQDIIYIFRLSNGDMISGRIVEIGDEGTADAYLKVKTELGELTIYQDQIEEIRLKERYYRHSHRIYLMPTAEAISDNHFIGLYELFLGYAGFGIADVLSVTAGRTLLPGIPSGDQGTLFNAKATLYKVPNTEMAGAVYFALGGNLAYVGQTPIAHLYGAATFTGERSRITGLLYSKVAGPDIFTVNVGEFGAFNAAYATGAFGIGLGLDTKFSERHDLHFIGELWNSDITRPTHTAVLLGLRTGNSDLSADFGLAFFTQPAVAPFVSFTFTPFFNSDFR